MIKQLKISNYALIKDLEMHPHQGLNTITGETGAGKSIMLGAVGLLLGNRADTKALLNAEEKCIVEGIFAIKVQQLQSLFDSNELDYADETILRREISPNGKSRAFINDTPVTLDVMRDIGSRLVDIHSQSDTLLLSSSNFQLDVIDAYAGNQQIVHEFGISYKQYKTAEKAYNDLNTQIQEIRREADYNTFLYEELYKAAFSPDEQELLEEELRLMEHAEEIKKKLEESLQILQEDELKAVIPHLQIVRRNLESLSHLSAGFGELAARVESCWIELRDIGDELRDEFLKVEFDPTRAEILNERLSLIYKLEQKHGVQSLPELLAIQADLLSKVQRIENLDTELEESKSKLNAIAKDLEEKAEKLSIARTQSFQPFCQQLEALLRDLGMPYATFSVTSTTTAPTTRGVDDLRFMFSANRGIRQEELRNVASGGEFSRLMFAIKYILAEKTAMPTIIFDEIDTGISGEVALQMVRMMAAMAAFHQVVVITHLPQIAAWGQKHFFVYKDESAGASVSRMRSLDGETREIEIAKMIGGNQPSASALANAKELLLARQTKA
ncbi:MAG: DNA repair protein RecN [Cyclobacteriaceae bacterium]